MSAAKNNKEKKAVGILRVSSDEQARKGASLESQEEWIRKTVQEMNLKIVKIIKDVVSGEIFPKKYFNEIVETVKKEKVQYLLVYSLDRLARNLPYGAFLLQKLYEIGKVKIVTSLGVFDLGNTVQRIQVEQFLVWAEMEQGSRSERTFRGMITRLEHGEWPLSPPFGYEVVDGKLRLVEEYKPIIIFIFETFIMVRSYAQTARMVNKKYGKSVGFELTASKVKKIIQDKTYLGYLRWNGMIFGEGDEKRPRQELRVIDEKIFNKAQAVAAQISKKYAKKDLAIVERLIEEYGIEDTIEILNLKPSCPKCGSYNVQRNGKEGEQLKFVCKDCNHQFRIPSKKQMKRLRENAYLSCPKCGSKELAVKKDGNFIEIKCENCGHAEIYEKYGYKIASKQTIKPSQIVSKKRGDNSQQKLESYLN